LHPVREKLKMQLIKESKGRPVCPLMPPALATDLHELITWPGRHLGDKYGRAIRPGREDAWLALASVYYVPELTCLVSNQANTTIADSSRSELFRFNIAKYGYERVAVAPQRLSGMLKSPGAFIPNLEWLINESITVHQGASDGSGPSPE